MQTQTETDNQLRTAVTMQIDWEPQVMSRDISVAAGEGVVTLTGFVHNYFEKTAAERAAKSVYGVKAVANDIEVKTAQQRTDPEIEYLELPKRRGDRHHVRPPSGDLLQHQKQADNGPDDVQRHLDDVGPNHRGHAALVGVEQG